MPTVLEPPPSRIQRQSSAITVSLRRQHWTDRLVRSGYFVGAVLLHLIVFVLLATWVVIRPPNPPPDQTPVHWISLPPIPPETPQVIAPTAPPLSVPTNVKTSHPISLKTDPSSFHFPVSIPGVGTTVGPNAKWNPTTPVLPKASGLAPRLPGILHQILDGQKRTIINIRSSGGDPKLYEGTFSVYVAHYADGDWDCNLTMKDGAIVAGSLPNLISKMREWSHGKMKGSVEALPLRISGPDLANVKPPFIFFTGHKDFVLTDAEIANLRDYLQNGGAIWGDNALPGFGSRFDVAFRREMRRVIPDLGKQFEPVPLTHEIFTKSFFHLTDLAQGMNFYDESIQHLDLDGKVAIIYTPNDYSDLFTMDLLPENDSMAPTWTVPGGSPLFTSGTFLWNSAIFFRNYTQPSSLAAQRLGMNIISYLLVRFDPDLILQQP